MGYQSSCFRVCWMPAGFKEKNYFFPSLLSSNVAWFARCTRDLICPWGMQNRPRTGVRHMTWDLRWLKINSTCTQNWKEMLFKVWLSGLTVRRLSHYTVGCCRKNKQIQRSQYATLKSISLLQQKRWGQIFDTIM